MVRRYNTREFEDQALGYAEPVPSADGWWVTYDDYKFLQSALREALDGWETERDRDYKPNARLTELRKFLDDK